MPSCALTFKVPAALYSMRRRQMPTEYIAPSSMRRAMPLRCGSVSVLPRMYLQRLFIRAEIGAVQDTSREWY